MRFKDVAKQALCVTAILGAAEAAAISRTASMPAGVQLLNAAPPKQMVVLRIALKRQNLDQLEPLLRQVSDPASPSYGHYLPADEVNNLFAPDASSAERVKEWLSSYGITDIEENGPFVDFETTIDIADRLLNAGFSWYDVQGTKKLRTLKYTIPAELANDIDLVTPTTYFGRPMRMPPYSVPSAIGPGDLSKLSQEDDGFDDIFCSELTVPQCLADAYNFADYEPDPCSGSRVGFSSFLNESASQRDLTNFLEAFDLPPQQLTTVLINGGVDRQGGPPAVGEANLDAQYLAAGVKTLPVTQYIVGGLGPLIPNLREPDQESNQNEPFLEFYEALLATPDEHVPQVISNSYGEDEQTVPREYAKRTCDLVGMMGLRGVTILEASGDSGVGAPCRANDGSGRKEFTPIFPGTCPYLTAVGGTQDWDPEKAWVGSSGGFSNYFARPWYQDQAVETYLAKFLPAETRAYYEDNGYVNFTGRGFPDVAAHSVSPDFVYINMGELGLTGGTSASAPVFAGVVGLLNDARLRAGLPTMGFLNPFVYGGGFRGLMDVTRGQARGCNGIDIQTGEEVPGAGIIPFATWNATEGWDPVTGYGLPDFEALRELATCQN